MTLAYREKWVSPVPAWSEATPEQRVLLDAAWRGGHLDFLLTPSQQRLHEKIRKWQRKHFRHGREFGIDSSRRWGKSAELLTLMLEDGQAHRDWQMVYVAPTMDQVTDIVLPLFHTLTMSCPPNIRPKWWKSEKAFEFCTGSRVKLVGLDTNPDAARGTGKDMIFLDEAGFFDSLEYLLRSILDPQMLGRQHARTIAASTPPVTPSHYWSTTFIPDCISAGAHDRRTLDDADQYDVEEIETFWQKAGGRDSVTARREYGAEHITDDSLAIVPEFRDAEARIVKEVPIPAWRDCYVSLDPGFHDLSACLFGYWDFVEARLVIEDEFAAPRLNSADLANEIKRVERLRWEGVRRRGPAGSYDTKPQPYLRVADRDLRLIADLYKDHGLAFIPTQKEGRLFLETAVNQVRVAIQTERIIIHPRCKKLIAHLRHGVWKKINRDFGREDDKGMGHFDLIAALVYMQRNVQKKRNPVPDVERYVMPGVPANDNRAAGARPASSKWADNDAKIRRQKGRYFVNMGRRIA